LHTTPPQQEAKDKSVAWGASSISKPEYIAEQKAKTSQLRNMMDEAVQTVPNFDQLQQIVNNLERCLTRDSKHEFLRVWIRDWTEHKLSKHTSAALEAKDEPDKYAMDIECTKCGAKQSGVLTVHITPPQRKPLTDEEIKALDYSGTRIDFVRAIEAAHDIKGEA
jgi:hypothetical protein